MDVEENPLAGRRRRLPPGFERRVVRLPPGSTYPYDETEWREALVVVEEGQIELESLDRHRQRFPCGAVLWLANLPLHAIHNHGPEPALLAAISRRRPDSVDTGVDVGSQ